MSNLYELATRYQQLFDQDELTYDECVELESLHGNIEDECISYGKYIRNKQSELEAVTLARKEMQEREKSLTATIDRNKERLANRMNDCQLKKITKSPLFPLRVQNNPVKVDDYARDLIPENFWSEKVTVVKSVNKDLVKKTIESGMEVPGARLISTLRVEFK